MANKLVTIIVDALEDMKAVDIRSLDVHEMTSITDVMIVCSGTSTRHVSSIADNVIEKCEASGFKPLGIEGDDHAEWVLVDLGDAVVHIMMPETRDFYKLERLWSVEARREHKSTTE